MNKIDIRDISIIDALPVYQCDKTILDVGCGIGRIGHILSNMGYRVYATDYVTHDTWCGTKLLSFHQADIFEPESFPIASSSVVICSEVLEHLMDYKRALANLLSLTQIRLVITVPFRRSFNNVSSPPEGHCNYWSNHLECDFKDINEFKKLCAPYAVSITKIRTKPGDVQRQQWAYLIVVDKRQKYG